MSVNYQSLAPPHIEEYDESDNSIQGSPLLDTSSRFSTLQHEASESFDFQEAPLSNELEAEVLPPSAYEDSLDLAVSTKPRSGGYHGISNASPPKISMPHQYGQQIAAPPMSPLMEEQSFEPNSHSSYVEEQERSFTSINQVTKSPPPRASYGHHRKSMPPSFEIPLEEKSAPLRFSINQSRPKSTFIDTPQKFEEPNRQPHNGDDDDDALPFETTKKMAWEGRPKSLLLPQMNTAPVMSKETFENYRRSVASLGMLKRMSSRGSFRSERSGNKDHGNEESDANGSDYGEDGKRGYNDEDEDEDEDEEDGHSQERKRRSAKIRQEQDARMSIYRQKMTKIIGGTMEPSITLDQHVQTGDAESLHNMANDEKSDNEDVLDDIPLSILQAHGFPKSRRHSSVSVYNGKVSPGNASTASLGTKSLRQSSPRPMSTSRMSHASIAPSHSPTLGDNISVGGKSPARKLPSIFGNKDGMLSRGLVSEIAKEEQFRKKRQTIGFDAAFRGEAGHEQQTTGTSGQRVAAPEELQAKLDQVLTLLTKMTGGDPNPGVAMPAGPTMWPSQSPHTRAPSIRSSYSIPSMQGFDQRGFIPPPGPPSQPGVYPLQGYSPQPFMPGTPMMHQSLSSLVSPSIQHPPYAMHQGSPNVPETRPAHTVYNRPSRMRLVNNNAEEEEDDETEWQKLMEKRKALREQWKQENVSPA